MSFYIDLSEFLLNPIRTGIQRISGEMCRYLPPDAAVPVRVHSGRYVALPTELIRRIGSYFADASDAALADIRRLGAPEGRPAVSRRAGEILLVPEVFNIEERLALFEAMSASDLESCRFIVYDLLPLTHPEFFDPEHLPGIYRYFHLLRRASGCGFISDYTRDTYYRRFKRVDSHNGMVLPLGSDALGPRVDRPKLGRPLNFTVLGTIEPRKNHSLILEAFEPLLRAINGLTLTFIGKMGWVNPEFARKIRSMASDPDSGFRFVPAPSDNSIRAYIEESRATIYVSLAEGFGLPPVESLWVGTPVIASSSIPSLDRLGSRGIHVVEPLDVMNLRRAVLAFLDDTYSNQKIEEASSMPLPTWRSFTEEVLTWCSS